MWKWGNEMKIDNTRIFAGEYMTRLNSGAMQQNKGLNLFSTNENSQDKIQQKRQEAREKAMGLMKDVFVAEKTIDDDLEERVARREEAKQTILAAYDELGAIEDQKAELKKTYGITEDCQEQKDLELLEKRRDSMKIDSNIVLTKEDWEELARIDEAGLTEYQRLSLEADASGAPYRDTIKEANKVIKEENIMIRGILQARLGSNPMVDAAAQAEEIMESANKEILGMILDEGKEKVDQNMEEIKEELDAAEEKQEVQEERIEEIQLEQEQMEEAIAARREAKKDDKIDLPEIPVEYLLELDTLKTEMKHEVDKMLHDMKLVMEDLKGSVVDSEI